MTSSRFRLLLLGLLVLLIAAVSLGAAMLNRGTARAARPTVKYWTEAPTDWQVIERAGANGRELPGLAGEILTVLAAGAEVEGTGEMARVQGETWREVTTADGMTVWVLDSLLGLPADLPAPPPPTSPPTPTPPTTPPTPTPPTTPATLPPTTTTTTAPEQPVFGSEDEGRWDVSGLAAGGSLNVRSAPGTDAGVVARLEHDATGVPSTGKVATLAGAKWRQLEYAAGKTGWVAARFLVPHVAPPPKPAAPGIIVMGDWRGSGVRTPAVFRDGVWQLRLSNSAGPADLVFEFGAAGATPVAGDWDGDGIETPGVVQGGVWHLRNSNSGGPADAQFAFGDGGTPIVGDWNGDGVDTPGTFRSGSWALRNSNSPGGADVAFTYGDPGDRPVVGDWNGDGVDTPGVVRGGVWLLSNSTSPGGADIELGFGDGADRSMAGDWNGDGIDTPGAVRGMTVLLRQSLSSGGADVAFTYDPAPAGATQPR